MSNLETTGRMTLWAIKLSKFDMQYHSRTTMKGQVVTDFVAEFTNIEGQGAEKHPQWSIHIDELSNM